MLVAVEEARLEAAARNLAERKESKRMSETPQGTWLGGPQRGSSDSATQSLWLRNGKVGSQVSGINQS